MIGAAALVAAVVAQVSGSSPEEPEGEVRPVLPADVRGDDVPGDEAEDDDGLAERVSLSGVLGLNTIWYGSDNDKQDGPELDVGALFLDADLLDRLTLHVEVDLDGEDTRNNLGEAWLGLDAGDGHRVRAGLMRVPLASEFATRPEDFPLVGYSFTTSLTARTDWGLMADGRVADHLWYMVSATAGEGFGLEGHRRRGDQLAARLVLTPALDEDGTFEGPFAGVAYAYVTGADEPIHLVTPLDQTVLRTPDLDGRRQRVAVLEVGWRQGPFRMGYEDVLGEGSTNLNSGLDGVPSPAGGRIDLEQLGAWTLYTAWTFGGDAPAWERGRWVPRPADEDATPVEVALRYSNADIDRQLFDVGLARYDPSTQEVRTFSAAVGSWVTAATRLTLQWVTVLADDDLSEFGGDDRANSWVFRWDQRF